MADRYRCLPDNGDSIALRCWQCKIAHFPNNARLCCSLRLRKNKSASSDGYANALGTISDCRQRTIGNDVRYRYLVRVVSQVVVVGKSDPAKRLSANLKWDGE